MVNEVLFSYTISRKNTIKPKAVIPTHYGNIVGHPTDGSDFKNYVEKSGESIQVELKL